MMKWILLRDAVRISLLQDVMEAIRVRFGPTQWISLVYEQVHVLFYATYVLCSMDLR